MEGGVHRSKSHQDTACSTPAGKIWLVIEYLPLAPVDVTGAFPGGPVGTGTVMV